MESADYSIGAGRFSLRNSATQAAYGEQMAYRQPENKKGSLKRLNCEFSGCLLLFVFPFRNFSFNNGMDIFR